MGIQASGKSTFCRDLLTGTHVHVSLDILRTRRREKDLVAACIAEHASFAVDDTNLARDVRAMFILAAKEAGHRVTGLFFRSVTAVSAARNALREGRARIPSHAIAASSDKPEMPSPEEGFNDLPAWQKRGIGFYFKQVEKQGMDPRDGSSVSSERRELVTDMELPMNDACASLLCGIMQRDEAPR